MKSRACPLLALALAGLPGCLLKPDLPREWEPELLRRAPAGMVALDDDWNSWEANGVLVHASERGVFVLTNAHVAQAILDDEDAVVRIPDPRTGEYRVLPVEVYAPGAAELGEAAARAEGDDLRAILQRFAGLTCDLALLRVRVEARDLTPAPFGVVSVDEGRGPFHVWPLHPDAAPAPNRVDRPGGFVAMAERSLVAGNSGSGIFDAEGRLYGIAAWTNVEVEGNVGHTSLDGIVGWLRARGLTWVAAPVDLDLRRVEVAAAAGDVAHLRRTLEDPRAYYDLKAAAAAGLVAAGALPAAEVERLLGQASCRLLRERVLAALVEREPARADALAVGLIESGGEIAVDVCVAAVGTRAAPLPRLDAALRAVADDRGRPEWVRAECALSLARRGARIDALPADLRDATLKRRLDDDLELPATRATCGEVCRTALVGVGADLVLSADLEPLLERTIALPAARASRAAWVAAALRLSAAEAGKGALFTVGPREGAVSVRAGMKLGDGR